MFRSRSVALRAAKDADDLELAALRAGIGVPIPLDEALYDDFLSEEASEQEINSDIASIPGLADDAIEESALEDTQIESVLAIADCVLQIRDQILGYHYPFVRDGSRLIYRGSATLIYELCLAIVHIENISLGPNKPLQAAFERLAGIAMSIAIGEADFLRTGYPKDLTVDDEPSNIYEAVGILASKMPDPWMIDPNSEIERPNDGGVDAVVFRTLDNRPGSLIFLGNCGCGKNWRNENKHRERPSEKLRDILSLPKVCNLLDFFALPFHITDRGDWREANREGRLFLDRLRIAKLLEAAALERGFEVERALRWPVAKLIQISDPSLNPGIRSNYSGDL